MKSKPPQRPREPESASKSKGNYIDAFLKRMFGRVVVFADFLDNCITNIEDREFYLQY